MRALVVDDSKEKAMLVAEWLKQLEFEVCLCHSYESALEQSNIYFDAVVVDYFLSDGNTGYDFVKMYCRNHSPRCTILYTAYPEDIKDNVKAIQLEAVREVLFEQFRTTYKTTPLKDTRFDIVIIRRDVDGLLSDVSKLKDTVSCHERSIIRIEEMVKHVMEDTSRIPQIYQEVMEFIAQNRTSAPRILFGLGGLITVGFAVLGFLVKL